MAVKITHCKCEECELMRKLAVQDNECRKIRFQVAMDYIEITGKLYDRSKKEE